MESDLDPELFLRNCSRKTLKSGFFEELESEFLNFQKPETASDFVVRIFGLRSS